MDTPRFPTTGSATLTLPGPAGALELIAEPAEAPARAAVAVVCHPLPTEGGTLHNKVVTMVARALRESGVAVVRFNFRGVGHSEGEFDQGRGEREDLRAVVDWVRGERPGHALWLAGFSFGAYVSLAMAAELDPGMLISVAPPAGRDWDFDAITLPDCPWLVIQGEADEVVDPEAVYAWLDSLDGRRVAPELVRMPDTGHFFHRRLMDLRGAVKNGVRSYLPAEITPPHG
jgi:hypothetical protein